METTIQTIDEQINNLILEKQRLEENASQEMLFDIFQEMTKGEIILKLKQMLEQSSLLKLEFKRLLIDNNSSDIIK